MAKYAFLNLPAYGYVIPTLSVIQELVARGEEVVYYLPDHFRELVESSGAMLRSYQIVETEPREYLHLDEKVAQIFKFLEVKISESWHIIPQIIEILRHERPDFIIYDSIMCLWARIVAESLHIPAITTRPSFAMNESTNPLKSNLPQVFQPDPAIVKPLRTELEKLCVTYGLSPFDLWDVFKHAELLNIIFIPRCFQPFEATFDERFVFVGPPIGERQHIDGFPLDKLRGQQVLYVSLGTEFNNRPDILNTCLAALREKSWQIVFAYGKKVDQALLEEMPENTIAAPYVPQLEVLKHTQVFISHGGMNSVLESLYYGVPLVVIPITSEHRMIARRVHELGVGIVLDTDRLVANNIQWAVEEVMNNPLYRLRAQATQQIVRDAGGYRRAADAIMQFAHTHRAGSTR